MRQPRKIIFETVVGSHLYGTDRPESDFDYCGVFLPATEDMLGLENCPTEWSQNVKLSTGDRNTAGDVDRKYYSLQRFLDLLAEGQSLQLEMLFAPKNREDYVSPDFPNHPGRLGLWQYPGRPFRGGWSRIKENKDLFLSKSSVLPFIGFAKAQAYKAVIKGENLNQIREVIGFLGAKHPHAEIGAALDYGNVKNLGCAPLKYVTTEGNTPALELAGRQYEFTQQVRYVLQKLKRIEKNYGSRSEAAAQSVYDYKSLMHAYRLIFEAKMLLSTGEMIFPLPVETRKFLLTIRRGEYKADFFDEIENQLTELRAIKEKSSLPEKVNRSKINDLCQEMLYEHLFKGSIE